MSAVERLSLRHPAGETPVFVGVGALSAAGEALASWVRGRTLFVVTTPRVAALHGERLAAARDAALRSAVLAVPEGEAAKTAERATALWQEMLERAGKRDSRLLAFGGGSVGDLGGFVAGCFLRGIEFAQAPTTLVAQADASIGGKTAIDLPAAKNAVGLFHQPALVVADTALLATLPRRELRSGLAEVVKMAYLLDPELLARVESDLDRLLGAEAEALAPVVVAAARAKIRLVEADPVERGARRLLNFGHTLGHALEAAAGYQGLAHGEAVAYGMLFALRLARRRGLAPQDAGRLRGLLGRLELPPLPAASPEALAAAMAGDKKARESGLPWVLPEALGRGRVVEGIAAREVAEELDRFLAAPFSD
jgi:3-dehydroquinate synthase